MWKTLKFSTNEGLPQFSRPSTRKPRNEIEATINGLSYHFDLKKLSQLLSFTFRCITTVTSSNLKCIATRKETKTKNKLRGDINIKIWNNRRLKHHFCWKTRNKKEILFLRFSCVLSSPGPVLFLIASPKIQKTQNINHSLCFMDLQASDDICEMFDRRRFGQRLNLNVEFDWLKIGSCTTLYPRNWANWITRSSSTTEVERVSTCAMETWLTLYTLNTIIFKLFKII